MLASVTVTTESVREPSAEIFSGVSAGLLKVSPKAIAGALKSLETLNLIE